MRFQIICLALLFSNQCALGKYHSSKSSKSSGFGGSKKPSTTYSSGNYGKTHSYPPSSTGLSGNSHPGKTHSYPPSSTGLSGNGYHYNNYHSNYNNNGHVGGYQPSQHYVPPFHQTPQFVYVQQYRDSNSRYSDILTGLALYNLGRSHRHHHYYYNDDYSRSRYGRVSESAPTRREDEASCSLKIKEDNSVSSVKIPCEIVSTFSPRSNDDIVESVSVSDVKSANCTNKSGQTVNGTLVSGTLVDAVIEDGRLVNGSVINGTIETGLLEWDVWDVRVNCTAFKSSSPAAVDPLNVKGPKLSVTSSMQCSVEILTQHRLETLPVDCKELMRYSRMPDARPRKLVPSKEQYRAWLNAPPAWLAFLFAV